MVQGENELIRRAKAGDADAFCLLAQQYERRIYSLALHYCRNSHDAEDLSQEAWMKAYRALETFRGESTFYTWLRQITINCFLNHLRGRSFRKQFQEIDNDIHNALSVDDTGSLSCSTMETTLQNRILLDRVLQALAEVTPHQRLIFLLKHHEGMTCDEIAQELGCSSGTVKKSLSRTVTKLRTHLEVNNESGEYVPCAAGQY